MPAENTSMISRNLSKWGHNYCFSRMTRESSTKVELYPRLGLKSHTVHKMELSSETDSTKAKTSRCCADGCKKKLALTDFACRCQNRYCSAHRDFLKHGCTYDYKAGQKENLLRFMSTSVVGKKMEVI